MLGRLPVLSLLGVSSLTIVTGSVLFGWIGLATGGAVQLLSTLLRLPQAEPLYVAGGLAAYLVAGAAAWLVFRHRPGLGRGFANMASLRWYAGVSAAGALFSAGTLCGLGEVDSLGRCVATWSRSTAITLWVFGPALLILGDRFLRRFLAPIAGEAAATAATDVALIDEAVPGEDLSVVSVTTRPLHRRRLVLGSLLAIALITAGKMELSGGWDAGIVWWNILYLLPVYALASQLRLRGGLVGAAVAGLASLAGDAALVPSGAVGPQLTLAIYGQLLLLLVFGALVGRGAQREGQLVDGLVASHRRLERDLHRVVRALTGALSEKDEYTSGHLQRVKDYALEVGRRLGLDRRDLELLHIAGTLHDVGKIGIPEQILNKRGPLEEEERRVMQRHPEIGARILARLEGLKEAAPIVLHHQERWDGRRDGPYPGYPAGLSGEAIPLGSRIIAVVDAFDAMVTDRSYRRGLPPAQALRVLREERARQFDPRVVDTFLAVLAERPWQKA